MRITVLDAATLGKELDLSPFNKFGEVTVYQTTTNDQLIDHAKDADILILNRIKLSEAEFKQLSNLKLVCLTATGYNNINLADAKNRNIAIANVVGYSTNSVAQHTFSLLLYFMQKIRFYDDYIKCRDFLGKPIFSYMERSWNEINGKKWGIIGLGNIGRKVGNIAKAFGADVSYYSTSGVKRDEEFNEVNLKELLNKSDIISIHAPINEKTKNLISEKEFQMAKKNLIILNLGRGGIIDEYALADAIDNNLIAGACLDVLVDEPVKIDNPLMNIKEKDRLLITPHIAWGSIESRNLVVEEICKNIEAFTNGEDRNVL